MVDRLVKCVWVVLAAGTAVGSELNGQFDLTVIEKYSLVHLGAFVINNFEYSFYRAMLRTARTMLSQDVRLPVTRRYSLETAKWLNVSSHFSHIGLPHHSSFFIPNCITIFRREPLTRALNNDFRLTYRFISEMIQDRAEWYLLWKANRNNIVIVKFGLEVTQGHWNLYHSKACVWLYTSFRMAPLSMILSDL